MYKQVKKKKGIVQKKKEFGIFYFEKGIRGIVQNKRYQIPFFLKREFFFLDIFCF